MSATFCQVPCPSCQMFKIQPSQPTEIINFLSSYVRLWKFLSCLFCFVFGEMALFAPPCVFHALASLASYLLALSADDDVGLQSKSVNINIEDVASDDVED